MSRRSKLKKLVNVVSLAYTVNAVRKKYNKFKGKRTRKEDKQIQD
jgi:hypothetical protein